MLKWAFIFLVIALIAALFGFTGITATAAGIAKYLNPKIALSSSPAVSQGNYFPFQGFQPARMFFSRSLHLSLTFVNVSMSPLRENL
jgi:Protein of unknown function (DUF1328)